MNSDDVIRMRHMAEAALEAIQFAAGRTRKDLEIDRMLVRALTKDVEIVGEAAARVTPETRLANPSIPWQSIVTMRNRLIHGYFDIDLDTVWSTVTDDLPPLLSALRNILPKTEVLPI